MDAEVIELSDSLKLYRIGHFNYYVFSGEKNVLIEVGWSCVAEKFLEVLEEDIDAIILTHAHSDHITGLPRILEEYPDAEVFAHENVSRLFQREKVVNIWLQEDAFVCGHEIKTENGFRVDRAVGDGDYVYGLEIYEATGHSPDSIIVYHRKSNALLISDCFGFITSSGVHAPLFFYSFEEYLNSIEKIASFRPEILGLGHIHVFRGRECDAVARKAREETLKARELIRSGASDEELYERFIVGELRLYPGETMLNSVKILKKRVLES
ncbi:MBL fold metallo-hydrolase [Geoglobus acetivorans]|uniref:Zn-dependent hydrolases including glyoxylases-like protein n=1 Tax=Geoglobus acetivorans TaxID=565033 RepID=A0A0A7GH33_GEOAI|nr:Zn-dependent hydrolases including glyoxylases-like protein [Geoglobus acetivorans]